MSLPYPIAASQTDAKSPVDDNLMDSIRENLDYLDDTISLGGNSVYTWNVNGVLSALPGLIAKRIDMQFLHESQVFSRVRIAQGFSGLTGVTEIDIRYHATPKTPITGIEHQFSDSTTSIAALGATVATQAIALATPTISTQSIARVKTAQNIQSIINVGTNLWRYNFSSVLDSDWKVGDSILVASATSGGNNGTFTIVEVNQSGFGSVVVTNASGVAQTGAAGTVNLQLWTYTFTNPVNAHFVAGEYAIFAGHTSANNSGIMLIYAANSGGNNVWVKNSIGVAQAGVAGTMQTSRWSYTYSSAAPSRFVVGESARFASHTTGDNNGDFQIRAVNSGGNNIIVTNVLGAAQAGVAGTVISLRWKYAFGSDPSSQVSIGQTVVMASHTTGANNGTFTVVDLNDTLANNIIVYNAAGVAQVGAAGTVVHTRKKVKFAADQSSVYSTSSYVELKDCPDSAYNLILSKLPFKVLEVNRGGGANYNIIIDVPTGALQSSPAGFVAFEGRSIFTAADGSKPQLAIDLISLTPNGLLKDTITGASISSTPVPAQTFIGLYILQTQTGSPESLSVMLS